MNNNYNPNTMVPNQSTAAPIQNLNGHIQNNFAQPAYAENILRQNKGKTVTLYMSYADSLEWRDGIFKGRIEDTGKDYILIYNTNDNKYYLLWTIYIDYAVFDEQINHY